MKHQIKIKNNNTSTEINENVQRAVNSVEIIIHDEKDRGLDIRVIYDLTNKTLRVVTDDYFNAIEKSFETFGYPED